MPRPKVPEDERAVGKHIRFPTSLWRELEAKVRPRARAAFVREAVAEKLDGIPEEERPFLDKFLAAADAMPAEIQDAVPSNASLEVDHYLYGSPRRQ